MTTKRTRFTLATSAAALLGFSALAIQPDKAAQSKLTPEAVLQDFKDGNARFMAGTPADKTTPERVKAATKGQFPKAYVLSCVDSRVPVEEVFDQGLGDTFVGRVAGNVENDDQLGSMEYAVAVGGVKLIIVMGHESCGAVKSACDNVQLGNASALLQKIRPAVRAVDTTRKKTSKDKKFVADVVKENVKRTVDDIRERSEVLADAEEAGKIKIVGAYYALEDGKVTFMD